MPRIPWPWEKKKQPQPKKMPPPIEAGNKGSMADFATPRPPRMRSDAQIWKDMQKEMKNQLERDLLGYRGGGSIATITTDTSSPFWRGHLYYTPISSSPAKMSWGQSYHTNPSILRLFQHTDLPWERPDLNLKRHQAIGYLFSPSSMTNDAAYVVQERVAKRVIMAAFGIGSKTWEEWGQDKATEVDPLFNKLMYYVAKLYYKAFATQNHLQKIELPESLYRDIIREIRFVEDPGFKKLEGLLVSWSGERPVSPPDELSFAEAEKDENWRRLVEKRRLPHPARPSTTQGHYPSPSSSYADPAVFLSRYPPLSREEAKRQAERMKQEVERMRRAMSPAAIGPSRWP